MDSEEAGGGEEGRRQEAEAESAPDICGHVIQHLNEEIQRREQNIEGNHTIISQLKVNTVNLN